MRNLLNPQRKSVRWIQQRAKVPSIRCHHHCEAMHPLPALVHMGLPGAPQSQLKGIIVPTRQAPSNLKDIHNPTTLFRSAILSPHIPLRATLRLAIMGINLHLYLHLHNSLLHHFHPSTQCRDNHSKQSHHHSLLLISIQGKNAIVMDAARFLNRAVT